jgi:hypothetical protein
MTNQERRERRRAAALKAARTRAAKQATTQAPAPAEPEPEAPTAREILARALEHGAEGALWRLAHERRWPTRATAWTPDQRRTASRFLEGFEPAPGGRQPKTYRDGSPRR